MKRGLTICIAGGVVVLFALVAGCGAKTPNTGMTKERIAPCEGKPSCISSTNKSASPRYIEPLTYTTERAKARAALEAVLTDWPRTRIVTADADYLHAECRTRVFRFVDDVEFLFDAEEKRILVRSAARVGYYDFGVNRRRIEDIRQALADRLK